MAFCPHCGKSVAEQASKCAACGGDLESRGKARFKGTMMMSAGTAPLIKPPTGAVAAPIAPSSPMPAPAPAAAPPPAAASVPAPAPNKPALKATMLGTGEGGLGMLQGLGIKPPQAAPQAAAPHAAAPAPQAAPTAPAPQTEPMAGAAAAPRREAAPDDDSKRFLVGDPMAPAHVTKAQRPQSRLSAEIPRDRSGMWIGIGLIGVLVIAVVGYFAARMMGLAE